jgi:hypothetical protein
MQSMQSMHPHCVFEPKFDRRVKKRSVQQSVQVGTRSMQPDTPPVSNFYSHSVW